MLDTLTERYHKLLDLVVARRGEVAKFVEFLEKETSWLTSPASTRFHLAGKQASPEQGAGAPKWLGD
jgi:hypothetical protein